MTTVVMTDYAWPDDSIERGIVEAAGLRLVSGPSEPGTASEVEALVRSNAPIGIMTNWAPVTAAAIGAAPRLEIVARLGVGLDNIDVAAATAAGAVVTNVPDYCVEEVSDHAIGLLLAWARGVVGFDKAVKTGVWAPASASLRRVRDLTVGIVGVGRIGAATARKLAAFGVRLIGYDPRADAIASAAMEAVAFQELLEQSDVVIVHAPLNPLTRGLFGDASFAAMKPGAFLINVSRGPLVDNDALLRALAGGRLGGAGLDVVEGEPSPPRALVERPDVIVTPHVAFSSTASLAELRRRTAEEVVRVIRGEAPRHPCNAPGPIS